MPISVSGKLQLDSNAISANDVLADIQRIKGAFKVYTSTVLNSTSVNYFSNGQIVFVEDSGSLYKANVLLADYVERFEDSVTFSEFSFDSGSFSSASFDSSSSTLTFFGQDLVGSGQISMSVDLSSLSGGGGGSGDITAVFTSDEGIIGGSSSGNVVLELDPGDGITVNANGINVNTGSAHFVGGVQQVEIDGDTF